MAHDGSLDNLPSNAHRGISAEAAVMLLRLEIRQ